MIGIEIAPQNIAPTLKALKQLEPEQIKKLRSDIKTELSSIMGQIQNSIPEAAPLSGMANNGRLGWKSPRVSISLTPGTYFKAKNYHPLVSITISGAAFKMAELAGSRGKVGSWRNRTPSYNNRWGQSQDHAITTQGASLIEALKQRYPFSGKAGRFAFKRYIQVQDGASEAVLKIINEYVDDFNRRWGI